MPKYQIADLVVDISPKYEILKNLLSKFQLSDEKNPKIPDFALSVSDEKIRNVHSNMVEGTKIGQTEEFIYSLAFNRAIVPYGGIFLHSSAIIYKSKAYLFTAPGGVGKSTHTKLWKQNFSDDVQYINDDKPVIRQINGKWIAFGTPFDGGSGIANNISAPLGGIIFLERSEQNSIKKLEKTSEILKYLYFSTIHRLKADKAEQMLKNFEDLIKSARFYNLRCNQTPSAAILARDYIISQ